MKRFLTSCLLATLFLSHSAYAAKGIIRSTGATGTPAKLERSGSVLGFASDVSGGQQMALPLAPIGQSFEPLRLEFYPAGNANLLKTIVSDMTATKPVRSDWSITSLNGGKSSVTLFAQTGTITGIGIPNIEQGSPNADPLYLEVATLGKITQFGSSSIRDTIQKSWTTSNFKLSLGNLPCTRITKIDGFTIKQEMTTNQGQGQSISQALVVSDISFEVPWADAQQFVERFQKEISGTLDPLTLEFELYDGTNRVISIQTDMNIISLGAQDPLDAAFLTNAALTTLKVKVGRGKDYVGHVTLMK